MTALAARLRLPVFVVQTIVATLLSAFAIALVIALPAWAGVPSALLFHAVSVKIALDGATTRRSTPLSDSERDAVRLLAAAVPVFGTAAAPFMPAPDEAEAVLTSHEVFERYQEYVKPSPPPWERTSFSGDFDRDLARRLDAQPYDEILRRGETGQKRSALRRLADLGRPEHLLLIRRCLEDPEHEVRLYAHGELSRLGERFEADLATAKAAVKASPTDPAAKEALALIHLAYARSGVLDRATGEFHFTQALELAMATVPVLSEEATFVRGMALAGLQRFEEARAVLAAAEPSERVRLARAEIAYRARDFAAARDEAEALLVEGRELPPWLEALLSIRPIAGGRSR